MNNLSLKLLTAGLVSAVSLSAYADNRIVTQVYHPDRVYSIYAKVGRAALIQLEEDERLQGDGATLGMGDSAAWKVGVRGNNITFKPSAAKPVTNMIVVSNKRTYVFDLMLSDKHHPPTYVMRFDYPDSRAKRNLQQQDRRARALGQLNANGGLNTLTRNDNYWARGDTALAPTAAYDNGRFTYFAFNNGRALPTLYRVEEDGSESLVNTHIEGDTVVVHETAARFVFRLGNSVLGIENRGFKAEGQFNRTGTDDQENVRLLK